MKIIEKLHKVSITDLYSEDPFLQPDDCVDLAIMIKRGGFRACVQEFFAGKQTQCIAKLQILSRLEDSVFMERISP